MKILFVRWLGRRLTLAFFVAAVLVLPELQAQPNSSTNTEPPPRDRSRDKDIAARIREEGMNNSKVMETIGYLCEGIGPRLTGSPNMKRANEWTRDQLCSWGLTNCHLEAWGPFGRGWSLEKFSVSVVEPQGFPVIACPAAWSPGFKEPINANVVHFNPGTNTDFDAWKGKLKGAIVLNGNVREIKEQTQSIYSRMTDAELLELANAGENTPISPGLYPAYSARARAPEITENGRSRPGTGQRRQFAGGGGASASASGSGGGNGGGSEGLRGTAGGGAGGGGGGGRVAADIPRPSEGGTNATRRGGSPEQRARFRNSGRALGFLADEGAALVLSPSFRGEGGTIFVQGASVPGASPFGGSGSNSPRAWSTNAPKIVPQATVASEDFNRLARMADRGDKLRMTVDFKASYHDSDLMSYNTVAEIPGTDLKDQIVMLGAHMDSWQAGTGATDNGAGVAATMEAMRILKALDLKPRRTIRIALWSGEEQGLYGSKAYVAKHFGYFTNQVAEALRSPKDNESDESATSASGTNAPPRRRLVRQPEYHRLSAYFNLDNGAGKIRGIHLQGNEAVRSLFRSWLRPVSDLGADTVTFSNTGSTDHISFDTVGLPAFQFIQDPLDYMTRTHHSNMDVLDRILPEDLKQASVILALFAYNTAMLDEPLPRKPLEETP